MTLLQVKERANQLKDQLGIMDGGDGVFRDELRNIEHVIHEVAHLVTLGGQLEQIPPFLSHHLEQQLLRISDRTADSLEMDTTAVTYLVGIRLGLWTDQLGDTDDAFINTCYGSLRCTWTRIAVEREFRGRIDSLEIEHMAGRIVDWFGPAVYNGDTDDQVS